MTKYIKAYLAYIEGFINERLESASDEVIDHVLSEFDMKIAEFQHERLIHLIITLFFGLFTLMQFAMIFFIQDNYYIFWAVLLMAFIFFVLLFAYICHYYFLENSVQKMYKLRDQIVKKKTK